MATLEDKILGDKLHNYCSSSEDSDQEDQKGAQPAEKALPEAGKWEGTSTNTGPKGVIEDWRKFKQLETEKRQETQRETIELAKKLTMTVRTTLDEEREKAAQEDPELAELLNDDFLLTYQKQRMQEMLQQANLKKTFGQLVLLRTGQEFLDSIDKEDKSVTIIIHVYESHSEPCRLLNDHLKRLSKVYDKVKFGAIVASTAGVSNKFKADGVPALLIYKGGGLIGNFVRLTNELGERFELEDVQSFLVEHGLLEDKSLTPVLVKSSAADESDSD